MNTPSILEAPKSLVITSRQLVTIINTLRKEEGIEAELLHKSFITKIELEFEEEITEQNILRSEYKDSSGKSNKQYELSKNQAIQLLMGESRKVRKKVIKYIEQLEGQLKEQNKFKVPQTFKEALLLAVEQQEVIEQLEIVNHSLKSKIEKDAPLVSFGNAIATSSDSILISDLAKVSGKIGRNNLFKRLKENLILCKNNLPRQQYIDLGYFEVTERVVKSVKGDLNTFTTHVTGKGQIWLLAKIDEFLEDDNK